MPTIWLPDPAKTRHTLEELGIIEPCPPSGIASGGGIITKEVEAPKPKIAVLNIEIKKSVYSESTITINKVIVE